MRVTFYAGPKDGDTIEVLTPHREFLIGNPARPLHPPLVRYVLLNVAGELVYVLEPVVRFFTNPPTPNP